MINTIPVEVDAALPLSHFFAKDSAGAACHVITTKSKEHALAAMAGIDLLAALKGVVAIADRKTVEFDRARAAIAKAEGK